MKILGAIRQEAYEIATFLAVIWGVFFVDCLLCCGQVNVGHFGLTPRTWRGLAGIVTMPFLHSDLLHVLGNTISLTVLLLLLAGSRAKSWAVVVAITLLGDGLLWAVGRQTCHLGANVLVFGLVTFLILSGFLEKRIIPLLISILVGFLYGGRLIVEVLPFSVSNLVSWDGHLCGAIAGVVVAYAMTRFPRLKRQHKGATEGRK